MKKLWFKAKTYGWGWTPVTWQGWLITIVYIVVIVYRASVVSIMFDTSTSFLFRYIFELLFLTVPLLVVCYLTGEKPGWRWGNKKK